MTATHPQSAQTPPPVSAAFPSDKARAGELYQQVKGTAKEAEFLGISALHPHKNASAGQYQAFLAALERAFAPAPPQTPLPTLTVQADPALPEDAPEQPAEPSGEPDAVASTENHETAASVLLSPPAPPLAELPFFQQLALMLSDGGLLKISLMKVGERLTLGLFPEHAGMPQLNVPLTLTEAPGWFDEHLPRHLAAYTAAQMDAAQVIAQAAKRQQAANQKAVQSKDQATHNDAAKPKDKPATGKSPKASDKPKAVSAGAKPTDKAPSGTYRVIFSASEGTQITATDGSKPVTVQLGENHLPMGTVVVTTTHDHFGTHTKTYLIRQNTEIDLDAQQGVLLQLDLQPQSAAVEATNGDVTLSILQGQRRLAAGQWTVTAEAAGHRSASETLTLKVGEPRAITLHLQPEQPF